MIFETPIPPPPELEEEIEAGRKLNRSLYITEQKENAAKWIETINKAIANKTYEINGHELLIFVPIVRHYAYARLVTIGWFEDAGWSVRILAFPDEGLSAKVYLSIPQTEPERPKPSLLKWLRYLFFGFKL